MSPLAPTIEPDLSIIIRKGICSTRILSPYYTALSYHILSQPFILVFRLFLLCLFQN